MWVSPNLCERGGTNREVAAAYDPLLARVLGDITRMAIAVVALSTNGLMCHPRWLMATTKWSQ
jgi:hypothetical protein